ncbi:hypothetical protein [Pectinatus frisingensis]|uniref:hypothetical protein n=1 Tax=Pectinatus frisingensis TaxID=865 RepID=UPI0015F60587|nr:hypothetical protein [Pectinatus frisingensis]
MIKIKDLAILSIVTAFIGGIVLSLIADTWLMLAASLIFIGCSIVISYLGGVLATAENTSGREDKKNIYHQHVYADK